MAMILSTIKEAHGDGVLSDEEKGAAKTLVLSNDARVLDAFDAAAGRIGSFVRALKAILRHAAITGGFGVWVGRARAKEWVAGGSVRHLDHRQSICGPFLFVFFLRGQ